MTVSRTPDLLELGRPTRVRQSGPIDDPSDPRHGTDTGYAAGCRNECCRRARARQRNYDRLYPGHHALVDSTGTHRRIQAMARLGWSYGEQSRQLGRQRDYITKLMRVERVQTATATRIRALYDALCMTPATGPRTSHTKRWAQKQGFHPPLAWDDIDDPDETPHTPRRVRRSKADRLEDFDWLTAHGESPEHAAEQIGIALESINTYRTKGVTAA